MKAHILTITLNPTVDYATDTERVAAGPKLRCTEPEIDPGGGGINVSRAIRYLGGQSTALIAIGGATGRASVCSSWRSRGWRRWPSRGPARRASRSA